MQRTLILYESRYGSTENIVKNMALILGPARCCKIDEFKDAYKDFECLVIGSPIYEEKVHNKILKFLIDNSEWLKNKLVAVFCNCLSVTRGEDYIKQMANILGNNLICSKVLGGKLELDILTKQDYSVIERFYQKNNIPLINIDMGNIREVIDFSLEIKRIKENFIRTIPERLLFKTIEEFLYCHNTCTLCTSAVGEVRGTPIEYNYEKGYIYIITEGGEKFANILLNNRVSISIYDKYENMMKLAGMQIKGVASIVDHNSSEYADILNISGISNDQLNFFPAMINVIKVKINKVEFLYSKFKNMGYEPRQIYIFKQ